MAPTPLPPLRHCPHYAMAYVSILKELEEAEFDREMEAIRTENPIFRHNSLVSSQFSENIES